MPNCEKCGDTGRVQKPCPDGIRGCAVYHCEPCDCQAKLGEAKRVAYMQGYEEGKKDNQKV